MRLYLDDNLAGHVLVGLLKRAGHTAVRPADAGLSSASDPRHFLYAAKNDLALLTGNHRDFGDLHDLVVGTGGAHGGVILIYFDNDPTKDMKPADIVRALGKVESSGIVVSDQLIVLNHWR
jgi:predicted nuclease of predicted toxin-antitoxin system